MSMETEKKGEVEVPAGKMRRIRVGSGNFLSQLFFLWVFPFIFRLRRDKSNFKDIELYLRASETAKNNDTILDKKWQEELRRAAEQNR